MLDIIYETEVEHFVRFVYDEEGYRRYIQGASVYVVDHPAWSSHHDVYAAFQEPELLFVGLASVYRSDADVSGAAEGLELYGDLDRELSRGCKHHRFDAFRMQGNQFEERYAECRCFSRSCLCLAYQVFSSAKKRRDDEFLYLCRFFEPFFQKSLHRRFG